MQIAAFVLLAAVQSFTARVVGVHDGDTITVYDGREQTRIRFEGIDCPESGVDFSQRAKQFTSDLVFGKQVWVEGKERDQYGRLVARIKVDGTDVSLALVEAGLAWHYKKYSDDAVLAAAETVAREKKVGVWSLPNPVPPWEHRAGTASGTTSSGPIPRDVRVSPCRQIEFSAHKRLNLSKDVERLIATLFLHAHQQLL